jgi:hypothetical protein
MTITKEQFNEYLNENWNEHFYKALVECVKNELFCHKNDEDKKDYRDELKQLIYSAVSDGVKDYLFSNEGEIVEIITKQFVKQFSYRQITLHID